MIKFYYEDNFSGAKLSSMVVTRAEHLEAVVSAFKVFLGAAGYHQASIAGIMYVGDDSRQGFSTRGDGNPAQGDLFEPRQGDFFDDTDEASGV